MSDSIRNGKYSSAMYEALEVLRFLGEKSLVAVPVEPTEAMVDAAAERFKLDPSLVKSVYEEMVLMADEELFVQERYDA